MAKFMNDLQKLLNGIQIDQPMGGDSDYDWRRTPMRVTTSAKPPETRYSGTSATTLSPVPAASEGSLTVGKITAMLEAVAPLMPASSYAGLGVTSDWLGSLTDPSRKSWEDEYMTKPVGLSATEALREREAARDLARVAANITKQAVEQTIAAVRADYPRLMGGRIVASGGGSNFERLIEILNVANFHRSEFGYGNHMGYQAHLERLAQKWNLNDHLQLLEHAKTITWEVQSWEPEPKVERAVVSDAPDALGAELEAALLGLADRTFASATGGGW